MKDTGAVSVGVKSNREKEVLRYLDSYREFALLIRSILLWQNGNPSYPFGILGATTLVFLQISSLEPLTMMCGIGLLLVLLDYLLPRISQRIWHNEDWTSAKQAQLESMSHSIACSIDYVLTVVHRLQQAKYSSPTTYYAVVVPTLFIFGWLGSVINNFFITYVIVLFLLMFPGLHHRGLIAKYYEMMLESVLQILKGFTQRKSISDKKLD